MYLVIGCIAWLVRGDKRLTINHYGGPEVLNLFLGKWFQQKCNIIIIITILVSGTLGEILRCRPCMRRSFSLHEISRLKNLLMQGLHLKISPSTTYCQKTFLSKPEMGRFRFRNRNWNWNWNWHIFQVGGIGIESTTKFSAEIGIEATIYCWNWNRNRNLTTVSGIGIECAGIVPSLIGTRPYCSSNGGSVRSPGFFFGVIP